MLFSSVYICIDTWETTFRPNDFKLNELFVFSLIIRVILWKTRENLGNQRVHRFDQFNLCCATEIGGTPGVHMTSYVPNQWTTWVDHQSTMEPYDPSFLGNHMKTGETWGNLGKSTGYMGNLR